jgi:uncharacterized membrane protein YjjP (DUF1212 family)
MSENKDIISSEKIPAKRFANLILDIGTFLLASGAHCGRLESNLGRLAATWGFEMNMSPSFKGLLVSVKEINDPSNSVTRYKTSPPHNVHLAILTDISHLSWRVQENNLSIDEVEKAFLLIKAKPSYNYLAVAVAVGLSCAGLCLFSLGDEINALVAFIGAFIGSLTRVWFAKKNFNAMVSISIAAFVTTLITGLGTLYGIGAHPEAAMATAVLYLIPGVPLINCVIDLIEGYLSSAMNRALFGGFILLCIAAGMTLCITLMGISNF